MVKPAPVQNLRNFLKNHSKDGKVTVEEYDNSYILHFDLIIDDSNNRWGNLQPMVSVVEIQNGLIQSFNIRLGKTDSSKSANKMRTEVIKSRPPCLDRFDTGHSDEVLNPHIRMNDSFCSVEEFIRFMRRLMRRLN